MEVRKSSVAGYFYPKTIKEIEELLNKVKEVEKIDFSIVEKDIIGAIIPHAGYIYSACEAMHFFEPMKSYKEKFDTIVIINPSHTGIGQDISLCQYKYWDSPYGKVEVDIDFQKHFDFPEDNSAQFKEHSGEVIIPYLKNSFNYDFKIVPICFKIQNYKNARLIAERLNKAVKATNKKVLLIASSDFSHYIDWKIGERLDKLAIDKIKTIDSIALEEVVYNNNLSICGFGPIMALLEYSKLVTNMPKVKVLRRGHSGEVTGNMSQVVNYNSIILYK